MLKKFILVCSLVIALLLILSTSEEAGASKSARRASASDAAQGQATRATQDGAAWDDTQTRPGGRVAGARFVAGEVLVKFKHRATADALAGDALNGRGVLAPPDAPALGALFERYDVTVVTQPFSRADSDALLSVVKLSSESLKHDARGTEELVEALRKDSEVEYAEPNYLVRTQWTPNDPYFASAGAWGQSFRDLWGLEKIGAEAAWELSRGAGVVVAVIDTGVDTDHEDISPNVWRNVGETGLDGAGSARAPIEVGAVGNP